MIVLLRQFTYLYRTYLTGIKYYLTFKSTALEAPDWELRQSVIALSRLTLPTRLKDSFCQMTSLCRIILRLATLFLPMSFPNHSQPEDQ